MAMARAGIIWPSFVHKPILSNLQPKHFYSIHLLFLSTPSLKVPNIVPSLVEMIMSASKEQSEQAAAQEQVQTPVQIAAEEKRKLSGDKQ